MIVAGHLKVGDPLGKYRVESHVGALGIGVAYRAKVAVQHKSGEMPRLEHGVLLEWLSTSADITPELAARIQREARSLRKLEHAGLAAPLEAIVQGRDIVLVSEAQEGTPLRAVAGERALDPSRALAIAMSALEPLRAAHLLGVTHGDLTIDSLIVKSASDGALDRVIVLGIGAIPILGMTGPIKRSQSVTSLLYAAPEQLHDRRDATPRSDVYAMGAILYELLTGRPPLTAEGASAMTVAVASELPTNLRALRPNLPVELDAIVMRALAKDPTDRFRDVEALLRALEEVDTTRPATKASISSNPPRAGRPADDEISWSVSASADGWPAGRRSDQPDRARTNRTLRQPCFSGALAQQQLSYARTRYGFEAVRRALDSLDSKERMDIDNATPISWVTVSSFERFHKALAKEVNKPIEETHSDIAAHAGTRTFNTLWRMLLRVGGAQLIMSRAPVVYSKTYDTGVVESRDIGATGGQFVLHGWPDVPEFVLRGLRAGMTAALTAVGRSGVQVTSTRSADGALFNARWRT